MIAGSASADQSLDGPMSATVLARVLEKDNGRASRRGARPALPGGLPVTSCTAAIYGGGRRSVRRPDLGYDARSLCRITARPADDRHQRLRCRRCAPDDRASLYREADLARPRGPVERKSGV